MAVEGKYPSKVKADAVSVHPAPSVEHAARGASAVAEDAALSAESIEKRIMVCSLGARVWTLKA